MLGKNVSRRHFVIFFLFFLENRIWHFLQIVSFRRQFAWSVRSYFLGKINKRPTGLLTEWNSHCRYADVMQHFSNPVIATNERIIIWAVLGFQEECFVVFFSFYHYLTIYGHNRQRNMTIWTNSQSRFNSRMDMKLGGNWPTDFWRESV